MTTALPDRHEQPRSTRPGMVQDRVALVTGGTRGIGAAICRELADQGAHIAAGFWHDHEAAEKFLADDGTSLPGATPSDGCVLACRQLSIRRPALPLRQSASEKAARTVACETACGRALGYDTGPRISFRFT